MRRLTLAVLLSLVALPGLAQSFRNTSGRNHPEIDWQVAETAHFLIVYPQHLAGIEAEAAAIAEASYDALAANLGVTFRRKIRLYVSDEDEVTNGFAAPLGTGYTQIWVHLNDVVDDWSGREKWLRKVIAHELAHLFHFQAVRANIGLLGQLFGDALPRFWTEGLAQYETETWDAQRGDRWLRTAVLDDRLSYEDGRSRWNGRLLYALGNSQVRFFAEQYGDSTLARMLAHRKPALFGLVRAHDFGTAFRATTGETYAAFSDRWRRHVNVYYNTLAGQMENPDSLTADSTGKALSVPGQYLDDLRYGPDTARVAVVSLPSLARPVRRLFVAERGAGGDVRIAAEGAIQTPVAWCPDGAQIAFARTVRGRYGSLLNDLFVVGADGRGERRLTHSRRAAAPAFSPDGRRLAFVGSHRGTANVFVLDLATGAEAPLTRLTGDVQLAGLRWSPDGARLAAACFDADGTRAVVLVDAATGATVPLTDGRHDDRRPVWSPDGLQIAFTSLRDGVPNVFVARAEAGATPERVTFLATGATAMDWLPPDSAFPAGSLVVVAHLSKSGDRAYRLPAGRRVAAPPLEVPPGYAAWTTHRPPQEVASRVAPNPALVVARRPYRALAHLTHALSLALPYYAGPDDWGVGGFTSWLEPLGKHLVVAGGAVSFAHPAARSGGFLTYQNNTLRPTLTLNLYRLPTSLRLYGSDLLVEEVGGGDVTMDWPLDWRARPYVGTALRARLRYADLRPYDADRFDAAQGLPRPEAGQQADATLALVRRKQRPWRDNLIHPLDGWGLKLAATAAAPLLGADSRFLRADIAAYRVLPAPGLHRLFVYGRAQAQRGTAFAQDYLGFSRYDDVQLPLPGEVPFTLGDAERVRGYRRPALGNRVLFGSAEYRVPFLPDLQTRVLGLVRLGGTALAAFADAGLVWRDAAFGDAVRRTGVGLEVKNALAVGPLSVAHALGVAQPASAFGTRRRVEVYYRLRAAVPF